MANYPIRAFGALHGANNKIWTIPRDPPNLSVDRNRISLNLLEELVEAETAEQTSLSIQFDSTL
jgi:hypothetical protein